MKIKISGLYVIVDTTFSPQYTYCELAHLILLGGCRILQLRMKKDSRLVYEEAKKIMQLKKKFNFIFIVNDFVDIAGEVGADGVHVGADDMKVASARARLGDKFIIGSSSSKGMEFGVEAQRQGADYVAFGAIYSTRSKGPLHPVQGIERLKEMVSSISVPLVAIGGINRNNISEVLSTGVSSVAMITAINQAKNVVEEVKWYVEKCECKQS